MILKPFAPVQFVYELSDTEGAAFPQALLQPFKTDGKIAFEQYKKILENMTRHSVDINEVEQGTNSAGSIQTCNPLKKTSYKDKTLKVHYTLLINRKMADEAKFSTIVHELGHLFCGHLGTISEKLWPKRTHLSKEIEEFEAECVAWLVCNRIGLKPPSAEYLNGYLNPGRTIPEISLEQVLKAAGQIEMMTKKLVTIPKEIIC